MKSQTSPPPAGEAVLGLPCGRQKLQGSKFEYSNKTMNISHSDLMCTLLLKSQFYLADILH